MSGPAEQKVFRNFNGGVNTAMVADNLPANVSPWGRNSILTSISGQVAVPARRRGFRIVNQTPIPGSTRVVKLVGFNYVTPDTGDIVQHLLAVSGSVSPSISRIDKVTLLTGAVTSIGTSVFSDEAAIPHATVAQNAVYFSNGTPADRQKVLLVGGVLTVQPWGLDPPGVPVLSSGGAGAMTGDVEVALSYRNADAGSVTSRGAHATLTTASESVVVDWSGLSIPSSVTHVKVHVRRTDLQAQFFEATEVPVATTSTTLDLTTAQLNALILLSPSLTAYGRPPSYTKGSCWHLSRMFVFDDTNLSWSGIGTPEQFNPNDYLPVNPKDGGKIIQIVQVHDSLLLILKTNAMWGLYGTSSTDWELRVINPGIGCAAAHSVQVLDGKVAWWSEDGPALWDQQGSPVTIGRDLLGDLTGDEAIDPDELGKMTSCLDTKHHRILWSAVKSGEVDNGVIFPFNIRMGVWESHEWDPFQVTALCVAENTSRITRVYAANPYGRVFEYGTADIDGARNITGTTVLTLTGTPEGATLTTMTDGTATFDTDGSGLAGLYLYVVNADTRQVQRRRIVSNTGVVLTTTPNWSVLPTSADRYYIACPMFEWDTKWEDWDQPFTKKRFTRLYAQLSVSSPASTSIYFDVFTRLDDITVRTTRTLTGSGSTGYWNLSEWDESYFEVTNVGEIRAWIGRTGRSVRIRTRYFEPNVGAVLLKIGLEGLLLSGRR